LSLASWAAPPLSASARLKGSDLGGNSFGSFCQTRVALFETHHASKPRPPGRNTALPSAQKNHLTLRRSKMYSEEMNSFAGHGKIGAAEYELLHEEV
ncbi:MAG: hypothetical protein WBO24_10245, partial [Nitrospirales bacterium]